MDTNCILYHKTSRKLKNCLGGYILPFGSAPVQNFSLVLHNKIALSPKSFCALSSQCYLTHIMQESIIPTGIKLVRSSLNQAACQRMAGTDKTESETGHTNSSGRRNGFYRRISFCINSSDQWLTESAQSVPNNPLIGRAKKFIFALLVLFEINKPIAQSTFGKNILRIGGVNLDLFAQIGDVEPQQMVIVDVLVSPHFG